MKSLEEGNSSTANDIMLLLLLFRTVWELFFVIPPAAVTWFRNWAHWTTFVMHACDQEVLLLRIFFASFVCSIKTQTDPQCETDRNMQESTKKLHTRDWRWWQQNGIPWILHSQCAHNLSELWDIKPINIFRPTTHFTRIFSKMASSPNL
jgi:hypothetical protein